MQTKNAAAVTTATLPPHSNPGAHVDLTVSSLETRAVFSEGRSCKAPLYGADGTVYVVGRGRARRWVRGREAPAGSVQRNHVTVGRVPGKWHRRTSARLASLGRRGRLAPATELRHRPTRGRGDQHALRRALGARARRSTVRIEVPERLADDVVAAIAEVQQLDVIADVPARVVIDERTGTVVLGADVRIREVAIAQGGLSITIDESFAVSQPDALAGGDTAVVPRTEVRATESRGSLQTVPATASLADVVTALNALGASPRDLVAIFQALHTAGALEAEIEVQ
ncbi:MAG: flagellar basal body P-ring protein FlgI [Polyangiales bacterium]